MSWAGPLLGSAFSTVIRSIPQLIKESKMARRGIKRKVSPKHTRKGTKYGKPNSSYKSGSSKRKLFKAKRSSFSARVVARPAGDPALMKYARVGKRVRPLYGTKLCPVVSTLNRQSLVFKSGPGRQGWNSFPSLVTTDMMKHINIAIKSKLATAGGINATNDNQGLWNTFDNDVLAGSGFASYNKAVSLLYGNSFRFNCTNHIEMMNAGNGGCIMELFYVEAVGLDYYADSQLTTDIAASDGGITTVNMLNTMDSAGSALYQQDYTSVGFWPWNAVAFKARYKVRRLCKRLMAPGCNYVFDHTLPYASIQSNSLGRILDISAASSNANLIYQKVNGWYLVRQRGLLSAVSAGSPTFSGAATAATYSPSEIVLTVDTRFISKLARPNSEVPTNVLRGFSGNADDFSTDTTLLNVNTEDDLITSVLNA